MDGTTLMAKGMPNAVAVLAVAERGTMYDPSAVFYMDKLAVGPEAAEVVDITAPPAVNVARVAKAKGDLARGRHGRASWTGRGTRNWSRKMRETGARIKFISDGDVAGAIMAAREGTGVDMLLGIGGTPEGDHRGLRAELHGRRDPGQALAPGRRRAAEGAGRRARPGPGATTGDLVSGDNVFFVATGVTDGELMRGVRYRAGGAQTQSIVMRGKSGTIRLVDSWHSLTKLRAYSSIDFDGPGTGLEG